MRSDPKCWEQFLNVLPEAEAAFKPGAGDRWFADLNRLACQRLERMGVAGVYGGDLCNVDQSEHFFSYRRDGKSSGRMAAVIWMEP